MVAVLVSCWNWFDAKATLRRQMLRIEMKNDNIVYEDLLAMQTRAIRMGFIDFARECYDFRMQIMDRYYRSIDSAYGPACEAKLRSLNYNS